jgi:ABC-type sugar transport system ATPase subunit
MRQAGVTIIYVSHRLEEIFELCQTVTVLRDGRKTGTLPVGELNHDELVRMMVGRDVESAVPVPPRAAANAIRLQVRRFSSRGQFSDFSLDLRSGEIVGLAGLVGAGRTEVLEALFGLDRHADGELVVDGKPTRVRSSRQAQRLGMTLIPEDRKRQGLVLGMNVRENLTISMIDRFRRALGWVDRRSEAALAERYRSELSIRAASVETPVSSVSGGNQQKIVFARGLDANCRILLVDEPTRGVDVGAKREIHDLVRHLAAKGTAVLLVSSDLPELLALSHRLVVLRQGKIVDELARDQTTPDTVLRAMAGIGPSTG